ncbi:hypothetical protein K7432_004576 [Basidiobolus ranarum]|uniref:Homeobox domain-containing protein n=1 Tax=Basidiobolus ranarum TaxID=34480 RepID=A0ABR2WY35_9FUNG
MSLKAALQNPSVSVPKTNSTSMFETFHQTPHGEFRTSFYNPYEVKHRKRTTRTQFSILEKAFQENPKPNSSIRKELAQKLSMTPRGVQVWFQNRRAKAKSQQPTLGENSESSRDSSQDSLVFSINSTNSNTFDQNQLLFESSVALSASGLLTHSDTNLLSDDTKHTSSHLSKHKPITDRTTTFQKPRAKRFNSLSTVTSHNLYSLETDYQQVHPGKRTYSFDVPSIHIATDSKPTASSALVYHDISPSFLTVSSPVDELNELHPFTPLCSEVDTPSNEQLNAPTDGSFQQILLHNTLTSACTNARRNSCPTECVPTFDNINFSTSNPQLSTIAENESIFGDQRGSSANPFGMGLKFQVDNSPHLMETPVSVTETEHSLPLPLLRTNSEGAKVTDSVLNKSHKLGRLNGRTHSEPIIHTPFTAELTNQFNMEMNTDFNLQASNFVNTQTPHNSMYQSIHFSDTCLDGPLPIATESMKGKMKSSCKNSKMSERLDFFNFDLNQNASSHHPMATISARTTIDGCVDNLQGSLYFPNSQEYST